MEVLTAAPASSPLKLSLASFVTSAAFCAWGSPVASQSPSELVQDVVAPTRDPGQITFDPYSSATFVGRTLNTTGDLILHRVDRTQGTAAPYGRPIHDPDGLAFDADGTFSGVPGTVLIGHHPRNLSVGQITAMLPDGQQTVLAGPAQGLANAGELKLEAGGTLLVSVFPGGNQQLLRIAPGGTTTQVLSLGARFAFDVTPQRTIVIHRRDSGAIEERSRTGQFIRQIGSLPSSNDPRIAASIGGPWTASVYAIDGPDLVAIHASGNTILANGFSNVIQNLGSGELAFGPDGALYVSAYRAGGVQQIERFAVSEQRGQPNGLNGVSLRVGGIGAGQSGPVMLPVAGGTSLSLTWSGPANAPYLLLGGAASTAPMALAPVQGLIDLDLAAGLSTVLDGFGPGGLFWTTGPSGSSTTSVTVPHLGSAQITLQGFVLTPAGLTSTASFTLLGR
jgi:hypothetical protein